jgi:hypothetical protein
MTEERAELNTLNTCEFQAASSNHAPNSWELVKFVSEFVSLLAGRLGCGDDFVEARITTQIIPARIEEEIAV